MSGAQQQVAEKVVKMETGMVRDMEAEFIMDINVAVSMYHWLGSKIEQLRQMHGVSDENWRKMIGGGPQN